MKIKSFRIFSFAIALAVLALLLVSSGLASTSLYADLSATPNTGQAPLNNVSLAASVSGDATGLITYRFDCTSDGTWDWIQTTAANPYTASSICNYPTAGNYTATIKVERDSLAFQGTVAILALAQATFPTVDLKVNGSDTTITIPYNTAATLSWTSNNATSCYGTDTGWQGYKSLSGSESTGSLLNSKTYVISCSGNGGTATDSVTVLLASNPVLYASLEAIPNNGIAPLNGVDLRATATGTASGSLNYRFDCTSDGVWDYTFNGIYDNPKTVVDACNYPTNGTYIAKVRIEQGSATPAEATAQVVVSPIVGNQDLLVLKTARNLSDNTAFAATTAADPGELIEFRILVTAIGSAPASNLVVRDTLPDKMSYFGNLKVDNVLTAGDILTGLNIGTLIPQQTRTITFQAMVASTNNFAYGTTDLVNNALAYNTTMAKSGTADVQVTKTSVLGVTTVSTGVLDSAKIAFLLSLVATLILSYFLLLRFYLGNKVYVWGVADVYKAAQTKIKSALPKDSAAKSEERLSRAISEIQKREKGIR